MAILEINNINNALIVGPIYNNYSKLEKINKLYNDYNKIILMGSIFYLSKNIKDVNNNLDLINKYKNIIYVITDLDYLTLHKLNINIDYNINLVLLKFISQSYVLVTSGGFNNKLNFNNLKDNIEISFINKINNTNWHEIYNGNLGYVISNNPLTKSYPTNYKYSTQIGNIFSDKTVTYAQEANKYGLGNLFEI